MNGYMIRCQGEGILTDRVYVEHPTDEQMRAALAIELRKHGFKTEAVEEIDESGESKKDDDGAPVMKLVRTPRERWVRVHLVEIVGTGQSDDAPSDTPELKTMRGILDAKQLADLLADMEKAPPGSAASATPMIVMHGTGKVANPGKPGHDAEKTSS